MAAGCAVDELGIDAHAVARLAHAALQRIAHGECRAHFGHRDRAALVGEGRVARDHEKTRDLREVGDDVFGHAVHEIFLLGIRAHVVERQHHDGGSIGNVYRGLGRAILRCRRIRLPTPDMCRRLDILEALRAAVFERGIYLAFHHAVHADRYAEPAGRTDRLQAGGDVHALAINVIVFNDDLPDVDAGANGKARHAGLLRFQRRHGVLGLNGAAHSIDRAGKFDQGAIAQMFDHAALVLFDGRHEDAVPPMAECCQRRALVRLHHAAIAHDIGAQDRCEPADDALCRHCRSFRTKFR